MRRRMRYHRLAAALTIVAAVGLTATAAPAFECLKINGRCVRWAQGGATLRSFLGTSSTPLLNGTLSWDQNAINAANDWNAAGAAFRFAVTVGGQFVNPCGSQGAGHVCPNTGPTGDNPVFFSDSFCGQDFGDIIELTNNCADRSTGAMLNAPVFVNANVNWNAYDGPLRAGNNGVINDIRRVLVHEFGHVLGLDHPDENGQQVVAIMNSRESNIDRITADDIAGLFSLYPNGGGAPVGSGGGAGPGCQIGSGGASPGGWLLLLPAGLGILRGRRRRLRS